MIVAVEPAAQAAVAKPPSARKAPPSASNASRTWTARELASPSAIRRLTSAFNAGATPTAQAPRLLFVLPARARDQSRSAPARMRVSDCGRWPIGPKRSRARPLFICPLACAPRWRPQFPPLTRRGDRAGPTPRGCRRSCVASSCLTRRWV